eukprot:gene13609-8908_t
MGPAAVQELSHERVDFVVAILQALQHQFWQPGHPVVQRGDIAPGLHFVLKGQATAYLQIAGVTEVLEVLAPGDWWGEAHEERTPAIATLVCNEWTELLFLDENAWNNADMKWP